MKKKHDLMIILVIYVLAFGLGYLASIPFEGMMLKTFVFDLAATVIVFLFSMIYHNSSVYDAYWSVAPLVIALWLMIVEKTGSKMQLLFLSVFLLWAVRLTLNWISVFTDFSYEDWRYIKYRNETPAIFWPVVNFVGIHLMPTLVVFGGMLPLFELVKHPLGWASVPGVLIMAFGIGLEHFADQQMHEFLAGDHPGQVCNVGLWRYSRHPNYLGEISFWVGVFLTMLPYVPEKWPYCIGCLSVAILFNVVSIPLMEKRQLARRPQYKEYREVTSRLLLFPPKENVEQDLYSNEEQG